MQIRKHPTSEKRFIRTCIVLIVGFFAAIALPLLLDNYFGALLDRIGFYYVCGLFVVFILVFIRLYYWLYHQPCPECGARTVTCMKSAELPGGWSARCNRCDILWDLGIGNSD
jgi:hypothetical protein